MPGLFQRPTKVPTPLANKDPSTTPRAAPPCCAAQVTVQPLSNPLFGGAKRAGDPQVGMGAESLSHHSR